MALSFCSLATSATFLVAFGWIVSDGSTVRSAPPASSPSPIEIEADSGIEWRQREKLVLARGNARAVRGDLTVRADVLSARYRELADGTTKIWRLEASGGVEITSPSEIIHADRGNFDLDNDILLLTGELVTLTTKNSEINARESMEYRTRSRTLIARGDASAIQNDQEMRGETITAYLREEGSEGSDESRLKRLEAENDVWIKTSNEIMRGDQATYDLDQGTATLTGAVRVTRGETQLNGCRGELDLTTGVSRLLACEDGPQGGSRVRGLIVPNTLNQEKEP